MRAPRGTRSASIPGALDPPAFFFVARPLGAKDFDESMFYAPDYDRRYRPVGTNPRFPEAS